MPWAIAVSESAEGSGRALPSATSSAAVLVVTDTLMEAIDGGCDMAEGAWLNPLERLRKTINAPAG